MSMASSARIATTGDGFDEAVDDNVLNIVVMKMAKMEKIIDKLVRSGAISEANAADIRESDDKKIAFVQILRKRHPHACHEFVKALIWTQQRDLAVRLWSPAKLELLKRELDQEESEGSSDGDGNQVSIASLDPAAVAENEKFYMLEKELYKDLPETDGVLHDLRVINSDPAFVRTLDKKNCYKNFSQPKGLALIFNNHTFNRNKSRTMPTRTGTNIDCNNVKNLLGQLGYTVKVKTDHTAKEMEDAMRRFAQKKEHHACDSAIVVLLTHGEHGQVLGSDCEPVPINFFVSLLDATNCPALLEKPKLFFIQACRGENFDRGIMTTDGGTAARAALFLERAQYLDAVDANKIRKMSIDQDFLMAFSTTPGYVSWRNSLHGTWFIQAICEIFARHAHNESILDLLTRVNAHVAEQMSSCGHKQIPDPSFRLVKKFFFFPGLHGLEAESLFG